MHQLLCQYRRRQNLNLGGRHPWFSLDSSAAHWTSGVFHQAGVMPPWHVSSLPFSVSEQAVSVATGTCTTNGWYLARFPFFFPSCVMFSSPLTSTNSRRNPLLRRRLSAHKKGIWKFSLVCRVELNIIVWSAGPTENDYARVCFLNWKFILTF